MATNNIDEELKLIALLERTNLSSVTEFEKILTQSLKKILGSLASFPSEFSRNRYRALLKEVQDLIIADYPKLYDLIREDQELWSAISYEANFATLATEVTGAAVASNFVKLPESAVKRVLDPSRDILGKTAEQHVKKLGVTTADKVLSSIASGVTTGTPTAKINSEIKEIYGNLARHQVDSLSRTLIYSAMNDANFEASVQIDNIAKTIDIAYSIAVMDFRTTVICQSLNGIKWYRKKDETLLAFRKRVETPSAKTHGKSARIPRHYGGCRSDLLFTTKEFVKEYESGTKTATIQDISHERKNMTYHYSQKYTVVENGEKVIKTPKSRKFRKISTQEIEAKLNNKQWFDRLDAKDQEGYLGKTKYKLYKEKNLSISDLWDLRKNKIFTIEQIQGIQSKA